MGRIFIAADPHGMSNRYYDFMRQVDNPQSDDIIIIAGDAGIEYGGQVSGSSKQMMKKFPGKWIIMRGNHDDRYWAEHTEDEEPINNSWEIIYDSPLYNSYLRQKKYPNILYIQDEGGIYRINGVNILFIPGAYSIDKAYRLHNGWAWNPDEQLLDNEKSLLMETVYFMNWSKQSIDFVISHTCPQYLEPYIRYLFLDGINQDSVDRSMEIWLNALSYQVEQNPHFKQWFFGHYHGDKAITDKYTMLYERIVNLDDYMEGVRNEGQGAICDL